MKLLVDARPLISRESQNCGYGIGYQTDLVLGKSDCRLARDGPRTLDWLLRRSVGLARGAVFHGSRWLKAWSLANSLEHLVQFLDADRRAALELPLSAIDLKLRTVLAELDGPLHMRRKRRNNRDSTPEQEQRACYDISLVAEIAEGGDYEEGGGYKPEKTCSNGFRSA